MRTARFADTISAGRIAAALAFLAMMSGTALGQVLEPISGKGDAGAAAGGRRPLRIERIALPAPAARLEIDEEGGDLISAFVQLTNGSWVRLVECGETLCAESSSARAAEIPADALPGSSVAYGEGRISRTWFADPVNRLSNGVLGDIGAASLAIEDLAKTVHKLVLPLDEAFDDLMPRLADLDGDGEAEILGVTSTMLRGSSLLAIRLDEVGPRVMAASEPSGMPGDWLNLVGIADFDGDRIQDIALVRSPYAGGRLEILNLTEDGFRKIRSLKGFSNHGPGAKATTMSAIADLDGDKLPDIVLPDAGRVSLRVISLAKGQVAEPFRIPLPAEVTTEIGVVPSPSGNGLMIVTGLSDGTLVIVR